MDAPISLKILLDIANEPEPSNLVARVYRSTSNRSGTLPVVEISGEDISAAQFPVKNGDLVVFSKKEEK